LTNKTYTNAMLSQHYLRPAFLTNRDHSGIVIKWKEIVLTTSNKVFIPVQKQGEHI